MNKKRLQKLEPFFAVSKHRANRIFHKFTFSSWLQQILILGDSSQKRGTSLIIIEGGIPMPLPSLDKGDVPVYGICLYMFQLIY